MKKLIAGLLSAAIALGCLALPAEVTEMIETGTVVEASTDTYEYGSFKYTWLNDGTIEITGYTGINSNVIIPSTIEYHEVSKIGDRVFCGSERMRSVTIPNTVTHIGDSAFAYCYNLSNITMSNSITEFGCQAFRGCTSLTSITLPNSVTSIGSGAFRDCSKLSNVSLPNSLISIGDGAFNSCFNLNSVEIPGSVTSVGNQAFNDTQIVNDQTTDVKYVGKWAVECDENVVSVSLKSDTIGIADSAFYYCPNLTSVTIPNNVVIIGDKAFSQCLSLADVTIPNSVTSIGVEAFCDTLVLTSQNNDVKYVDKWVIECSKKVFSVSLNPDTIGIADRAFYGCNNIIDIAIPDSVANIGNEAFYNCYIEDVYYTGTKDKWNAINGNTKLTTAKIHYNYDPNHIHSYISTITKVATCTEFGIKTYTCSCEDTYTEIIEATGHTYSTSWTTDKVATCTATGSKSHHCTVCGAKTDVTTIPKTAHTYDSGKITKAATCTATGVRTYTCSCGDTYTETIKSTGHSYSTSWTTDKVATCTATGSKSHHCTVCGAKTDVTAIPKKSHTYKTTVVSPTYAAQGYTLHKCSVCGTSYKDKYTAKKTVPTVTAKSTYTCTTNAVRINWNKLSGVTGYKIYRYNPTTKQWTALKAIYDPNVLTYKDSSLKSGTVYKYKVKAFVKSGGKFYFGSSCSTITTATKPTTATITKTAKSSTAVRLYWKKATCTGYKIQRYNATTKKWVDVKALSSGTTNYRIASLKKNTSYKFRVCAYKNDGKKNLLGAWSYVTVKTTK